MILALMLAAASSAKPDAGAVAKVEAGYAPPAHAQALDGYVRWYWADPAHPGGVDGIYLAASLAAHLHAGPGARVRIVTAEEAPRVMDGGCGVVHVHSRAPYDSVDARCGGR